MNAYIWKRINRQTKICLTWKLYYELAFFQILELIARSWSMGFVWWLSSGICLMTVFIFTGAISAGLIFFFTFREWLIGASCSVFVAYRIWRWHNTPGENRKCILCQSEDIGNEYHNILICISLSNERKLYLKSRFYNGPNTLEFNELMNSQCLPDLNNWFKISCIYTS